ncbi:MAG: hypothetical protein LUO95_01370 [Methylococcaceae bacterium]|nr:hypothetical protein [Methylococcaceae bacterium]MDD1609282.1 hypothetical protein [Methylococcaceae bacterium]MDD1615586.1 hypothetical protein [Methylococcaceae bacterium]OYV19939.1 MAG: hypothetical protein CG439_675 [Methylococcaceae bacterium NSP1-2]
MILGYLIAYFFISSNWNQNKNELNTQILLGALFGIAIGLDLLAIGKTAAITQFSL